MCNYIVRIYRSEKNNPQKLVGVIEEVGIKGKKAFTNYDELWDILNFPKKHHTGRQRDEKSVK